MARIARELSSTGIYHVMMRGNNRQQIFEDNEDYYTFLRILKRLQSDTCPKWVLYAYVLMGNHFHLLVNMQDMELGELMKAIAAAYVIHYNGRHGRDGHLFRERYKSEPCEDTDYLLTLVRYIHRNPVKAGICQRVENYRFTSWQEYEGKVAPEVQVCNTEDILSIMPLEELRDFLEDSDPNEEKCMDYTEGMAHASDSQIIGYLRDKYRIYEPVMLQGLPVIQRNVILRELKKLGAGVRQLQRLTGIGASIISRVK